MSKDFRKDWALEMAKKNGADVEVVMCPASDKELFYKSSTGKYFSVDSFGFCSECKKPFHVTKLRTPEGMDHCSWPVEYEGLMCKTCHEGPSQAHIDSIKLNVRDPYDD